MRACKKRPHAAAGVVCQCGQVNPKGIPKIRLVQSLGESSFKTDPKQAFPQAGTVHSPSIRRDPRTVLFEGGAGETLYVRSGGTGLEIGRISCHSKLA